MDQDLPVWHPSLWKLEAWEPVAEVLYAKEVAERFHGIKEPIEVERLVAIASFTNACKAYTRLENQVRRLKAELRSYRTQV